MSGRRVHSEESAAEQVEAIYGLYLSVPHPDCLDEKVFAACIAHMGLPPSLRDPDQFRKDVTEAISLASAQLYPHDPLYESLFWYALALVSAREHIVLQPGTAPHGGRLQ